MSWLLSRDVCYIKGVMLLCTWFVRGCVLDRTHQDEAAGKLPGYCAHSVVSVLLYVCMYVYRFQNVFLRCPTPRLHWFLSSHWPSFSFLSCMAFFIPSIQFFFGFPRILLCFGIHFNAILGNLSSAIRWTWPYHVSWFCSISFIIVSSSPICCLIVTFLIYGYNKKLHPSLPSQANVSEIIMKFSGIQNSSQPTKIASVVQSVLLVL